MKHKNYNIRLAGSRNSESQTVTLEGDLGMINAVSIRKSLGALEIKSEAITLHLKNVEKLDITTIQTLVAFEKHLLKNGKKHKVLAELPAETEKLIVNSGLKSSLIIS